MYSFKVCYIYGLKYSNIKDRAYVDIKVYIEVNTEQQQQSVSCLNTIISSSFLIYIYIKPISAAMRLALIGQPFIITVMHIRCYPTYLSKLQTGYYQREITHTSYSDMNIYQQVRLKKFQHVHTNIVSLNRIDQFSFFIPFFLS